MTDRIEKQILIRAPRARVWQALVDKTEFGTWFKVNFPPGTFVPGERVSGRITYPGYEHLDMDVHVVDVVPERRLSYRWLPGMPEPGVDYESEPMTLVTFTLEDAPDGTLLTLVESGLDQLPPERREKVFRVNEGGWAEQMTNIERHVAGG